MMSITCFNCNGTGTDRVDGPRCRLCGGSGTSDELPLPVEQFYPPYAGQRPLPPYPPGHPLRPTLSALRTEVHALIKDTQQRLLDQRYAAMDEVARQILATGIDPARVEIVTKNENSKGRIGFKVYARLKEEGGDA